MKKQLLMLAVLGAGTLGAANAQQRVPLFEIFTSSTCPPCKPGNEVYHNVVNSKPASEYVSVKYQQNFPGSGDPYCTDETVNRRSGYYAITSIPRMEIDGGWNQNAQSFTNTLYNNARAVPAEFDLAGAYTFNTSTKALTAKLRYSPLTTAAGTGAKLYVAILESVTAQNVKNNGETEFHDVVKKMLPTEGGTTLPTMTVGQKDSTTLSFTFMGNFRLPANGTQPERINHATEHSVENFNNLKVVAWVQGSDKKVHQAAHLMKVGNLDVKDVSTTVGNYAVFPNPANNSVTINLDMKQADNVTALIVAMNGSVAASKSVDMKAGSNQMTFDLSNVANGVYNLIILDSHNNSFTQHLSVVH